MKGFVQHILSRHTTPDRNVQPRMRSRFESRETTAVGLKMENHQEHDLDNHSPKDQHLGLTSDTLQQPNDPSRTNQPTIPIQQLAPRSFNPQQPPAEWQGIKQVLSKEVQEYKGQSTDNTLPNEKKESAKNQPNLIAPHSIKSERNTVESSSNNSEQALSEQPNHTPLYEKTMDRIGTTNWNDLSIAKEFQASFAPIPDRQPAPVIKVTIGRIDVRASVQAPLPPARPPRKAMPNLSLDAYFKKQNPKSK